MPLAMQTLTEMPKAFAAGTTLEYTRSLSDFPATDGWTLQVALRGEQLANAAVSASGSDFLVTFAAADTALLPSGVYSWVERVTKAGKIKDGASGTVFVSPDVLAAGAGALQTYEEIVLAALKAKLLGRITTDQELVRVDNMEIAHIPLERVAVLVPIWQAKVNAQRAVDQPVSIMRATLSRPT